MFKTIFTVVRKQGDSTLYHAFFEDLKEAMEYAKKEVDDIKDYCVSAHRHYQDGDFIYQWIGENNEVILHGNDWITTHNTKGIAFHHHGGLVSQFESYQAFQNYIKKTRQ